VALLASRWIERLLAAHEPQLTLGQFLALRTIAREPVTSAELARRTGVSSAAVSQLIAVVDQAGWIERTHAPADRRRQVLALTPAGKRVYASSSRTVNAWLTEFLGALPQLEADRLGRLLERLEHALGGTPPPRRPPPPRRHA
jgi:DNA-binding MarR family transcriptional regulator